MRAVLAQLTACAEPLRVSARASELRARLAELGGLLAVHFAREDRYLYPMAAAHPDPELRRLGDEFAAELGGLRGRCAAFIRRWSEPEYIRRDPAGFAFNVARLAEALERRMRREEAELYPAVDVHQPGGAASA